MSSIQMATQITKCPTETNKNLNEMIYTNSIFVNFIIFYYGLFQMVFVYGLRQSLLPIKLNHFYLFLCIINLLKCKPNCLFWVGHRDRWEYPRHGSSIHVIERVDSRPLLGRQFVSNIPAWKIKPNETQLSLTSPTTTNDIGWSTIQTTLNLIPDWVFSI